MLDCLLIEFKTLSYLYIAYIIMNRIKVLVLLKLLLAVHVYKNNFIKSSQRKTIIDYVSDDKFIKKLYKHWFISMMQLYHHGEKIAANICIRNNSNKVVKKIKAMVQQGIDVVLFQNGQYRSAVAGMETQ